MVMRKQYKDIFLKKHNLKLGFMSPFIKASSVALQQMPTVNAGKKYQIIWLFLLLALYKNSKLSFKNFLLLTGIDEPVWIDTSKPVYAALSLGFHSYTLLFPEVVIHNLSGKLTMGLLGLKHDREEPARNRWRGGLPCPFLKMKIRCIDVEKMPWFCSNLPFKMLF